MCEEKSEHMLANTDKSDPPAIVTQHSDHPRRFVLLSAQASGLYSNLKTAIAHYVNRRYIISWLSKPQDTTVIKIN